jgi:hypothetical protein
MFQLARCPWRWGSGEGERQRRERERRERERERGERGERERRERREREERLHAPIHQAILGYVIKSAFVGGNLEGSGEDSCVARRGAHTRQSRCTHKTVKTTCKTVKAT